MGGMAVLEWPLCTPTGFVRRIIPIATSARHSAWCISWGEAQRQSIYSDPAYDDGFYDTRTQPVAGLAAARMAALHAGIPNTSAVNTVNRQCSSGLTAVNQIANEILAGEIDIGIGASPFRLDPPPHR